MDVRVVARVGEGGEGGEVGALGADDACEAVGLGHAPREGVVVQDEVVSWGDGVGDWWAACREI